MDTTVLKNKDKVQKEALKAWSENNFFGTVNLPTGSGKTRLIVLSAGEHIRRSDFKEKWLVLVPTERLRDVEIPSEFKKWGYEEEFKKCVTVMCYASGYKMEGQVWDGICADEIHLGLSEKYGEVFKNNEFKRFIALSATVEDKEKLSILESFAPIVYTKTVKEALELGLISDYRVYNLAVPFTKEEYEEYQSIQSDFERYTAALGGSSTMFVIMAKLKRKANLSPYEYKYLAAVRKRKQLLYNAQNKILATQEIIEKFPDRHAIFFSESIDSATKVYNYIGDRAALYHSKLSKEAKEHFLKEFCDLVSGVNVLCSAKALNTGANFEHCSLGICGSGNSKKLDEIQRLGRTIRLEKKKIAIFVNLYIPETQEVVWLNSRLQDRECKWVSSIDEINVA